MPFLILDQSEIWGPWTQHRNIQDPFSLMFPTGFLCGHLPGKHFPFVLCLAAGLDLYFSTCYCLSILLTPLFTNQLSGDIPPLFFSFPGFYRNNENFSHLSEIPVIIVNMENTANVKKLQSEKIPKIPTVNAGEASKSLPHSGEAWILLKFVLNTFN